MTLKIKILFCLFFVTIISFGQTKKKDSLELPPPPPPKETNQNPAKGQTWQNDEYKVKLSIPTSWRSIPPNKGELVSFVSTKEEIFAIRAYHFITPGTVDEIRQNLEAGLKTQLPKHKVISSKVIKIGDIEAADIIMQGAIGTSDGIYRGISFHNSKNSFIITCFYLPADKTNYDKTLKDILNSITFF